MDWIVDNATKFYIFLGLIALALVLIWRNNRQNKYLGYAVGVLVAMGLIWLLRQFYASDSMQLNQIVEAMAQGVIDCKPDDVFKHVSKDFAYKGLTRDMLYKATQKSIESHEVTRIKITSFKVED